MNIDDSNDDHLIFDDSKLTNRVEKKNIKEKFYRKQQASMFGRASFIKDKKEDENDDLKDNHKMNNNANNDTIDFAIDQEQVALNFVVL